MILRTERLVVRPLERADLDQMAAWPRFPDPLDLGWNWPQQLKADGTTSLFFLSRASDPQVRDWTITTHDQQVIGYLGLRTVQQVERQARLSIALGYPFLARGYGTEALRAFLDAFFGQLGFATMTLDVAAYNQHARQVYRRLGFREAGEAWQRLGPVASFGFLADPAYDQIRPLFRAVGDTMLVRAHQLELSAADWQLEGATRQA